MYQLQYHHPVCLDIYMNIPLSPTLIIPWLEPIIYPDRLTHDPMFGSARDGKHNQTCHPIRWEVSQGGLTSIAEVCDKYRGCVCDKYRKYNFLSSVVSNGFTVFGKVGLITFLQNNYPGLARSKINIFEF